MTDFLTLEDVNSAIMQYYNSDWWDTITVDIKDKQNFQGIKIDYLEINRYISNNKYYWTIGVQNDISSNIIYVTDKNGNSIELATQNRNTITFYTVENIPFDVHILNSLFIESSGTSFAPFKITGINHNMVKKNDNINLIFDIETIYPYYTNLLPSTVRVYYNSYQYTEYTVECENGQLVLENINTRDTYFPIPYQRGEINCLQVEIIHRGTNHHNLHYIVRLPYLKHLICLVSDDTVLKTGEINHITLHSDYNGVLNISKLNINSNYNISNIQVNNQLIEFDIDLTDKNDLKSVNLNIVYEDDDIYPINKDFVFDVEYRTINTFDELKNFINSNGEIARLGANITLAESVTVPNDLLLIGNGFNIDCNQYNFIVNENVLFKAENTVFNNGKNTIQQLINSTVDLNNCSFFDCISDTGLGAVIDCDIDLNSLDNASDFTTNITNCTFNNNDCAILSGGELNVTGCTVTGKIENYDYPYFLYQTDGNATILKSIFNISSDTRINEDIKFNSCIFICGENAIINGHSHDELSKNNLTDFLSNPINNTSNIDITYYYSSIDNYIQLKSNNGYCHSVSNVDFVFKSNVNIKRVD